MQYVWEENTIFDFFFFFFLAGISLQLFTKTDFAVWAHVGSIDFSTEQVNRFW